MFNITSYLLVLLILLVFFFCSCNLRYKITLFILITILLTVVGCLLDLDGIFLVFLTAELTIILLLIMVYLQVYKTSLFESQRNPVIVLGSILVISIFLAHTNQFFYHINYYRAISFIVSSDFFLLYYLLFEKLVIGTLYVILIISLFSLFFICLYFNLKLTKVTKQIELKNIYFLRKQVLHKQTNFSQNLYSFQN